MYSTLWCVRHPDKESDSDTCYNRMSLEDTVLSEKARHQRTDIVWCRKRRNKVNKHASFFCCLSSRSSSIISSAPAAFLISVPAVSVPPVGPLPWRLPLPGMLGTPPPPPPPPSVLWDSAGPLLLSHAITPSPLPSSLGAPVLCSSKAVSTLETHFL